jgi:hypothetical protein
MYRSNPYRPFPPEVRGDEQGAFYERILNDGAASLYVIVRPRRYMTDRDVRLVESGQFSIEELHPQVRRLGREPRPDTLWIYEVEAFEVDRAHHQNQETFADNARTYTSTVFDDFDDLMDYCGQTFGISPRDFKKSWETRYPQS